MVRGSSVGSTPSLDALPVGCQAWHCDHASCAAHSVACLALWGSHSMLPTHTPTHQPTHPPAWKLTGERAKPRKRE